MPGGPWMYRATRKLRGLQAPFAYDPSASERLAAG